MISKQQQMNTLLHTESLLPNDKINLKYMSNNQSPASGWKRLQYNQYTQRPPRLGDCAGKITESPRLGYPTNSELNSHDSVIPVTASTTTTTSSTATGTATQFSVSFESPLEACPLGTRLSPVGSSCWSSEQHISPDLTSLMSSSTNSVSAGISLKPVQSASQSVRSAPLCASQLTRSKWSKQMTISRNINSHYFTPPPPPSLVVSDPEEEMHNKRLQL
ncbi:unnamed protein product [Trichobilharzia regenti]|nr:unnamed protein product [Trichobilharzia regenti]